MTDKDPAQPEPVRAPLAPFRTFGPVVIVYLLATLLTGAQFWGDSIDYAESILDHRNFWDFGHLFWRPLGWLLAKALMPLMQVLGAADERTGVLLLLVGVSWLAGLGSLLLLRGLLAEARVRPWVADATTLACLVSQAFLNFVHTASSYAAGLCCLFLGCYLLARAGNRSTAGGRSAVAAGVALACAVGFWFPYVWALPAAVLLPVLLNGLDRSRLRLSVSAALVCAASIGLFNAAALLIQGISTVEGALAWVAAAQHGITGVHGVTRMIFGLARSFVNVGEVGAMCRRYLNPDPLEPVSLAALLQAGLWQIGLFYLLVGAIAVGLARSASGRRLIVLLAVACLPTLAFGIAWQGGDMERYLPLYPFLFLSLGCLLNLERVSWLCRGLALGFFVVVAVGDARVMARPALDRQQEELSAQALELTGHIQPDSRVFTINNDVAKLRRNFPLNPLGHRLRMSAAVEPGTSRLSAWHDSMRRRLQQTWERGNDAWVAKRVFSPRPRAEWLWVDEPASEVRWASVHAFFKELETAECVGGEDGFVRLPASAANRMRVAAQPTESAQAALHMAR